jgi:hypothetical protein
MLVLLALAITPVAFADETTIVVVSPDNMNGWFFLPENSTGGTGELVSGPPSPPAGNGSARLVPTDSNGSINIAALLHPGTPLSDITKLEYSTYRASGGPVQAISLQFNVDMDVTDANTTFQGRLVQLCRSHERVQITKGRPL